MYRFINHPNILYLNPNHPKSSQILQKQFFWKNSALLETGTFKWGKMTTWQQVQAISAEYERSTKTHGAFWR